MAAEQLCQPSNYPFGPENKQLEAAAAVLPAAYQGLNPWANSTLNSLRVITSLTSSTIGCDNLNVGQLVYPNSIPGDAPGSYNVVCDTSGNLSLVKPAVPPTLAYFSTQFNNNFTVNNVITSPVQLVGNNTINNMIYSDFSITVVNQGTYNIQFIVQCDFSTVVAPISTLLAYAISINGSLSNALTNPQYNVAGCVINCSIILPLNVGDIIQVFRQAVSNPGTTSYIETNPQLTITQLY